MGSEVNQPHQDALKAAELDKLRLEIQDLRARTAWDGRVARLLSILSTAIVIIGALAGLWEYRDTKTQEYESRFWEHRLAVYSRLLNAAAKVAVARPESAATTRDDDFRAFAEIYHGDFLLTADDAAAAAALDFYGTYLNYRQEPSTERQLLSSVRALALSCRTALAASSNGLLDTGKLSAYESANLEGR